MNVFLDRLSEKYALLSHYLNNIMPLLSLYDLHLFTLPTDVPLQIKYCINTWVTAHIAFVLNTYDPIYIFMLQVYFLLVYGNTLFAFA